MNKEEIKLLFPDKTDRSNVNILIEQTKKEERERIIQKIMNFNAYKKQITERILAQMDFKNEIVKEINKRT